MSNNNPPKDKGPEKRVSVQGHFNPLLDQVLDVTQIGLWDWDLRSGQVLYSPQWERIAGYEPGELPQQVSSWENAVLPQDLPAAEAEIRRHLEGKTPFYQAEFRLRRKDGSVIWAQDKGFTTEWDEAGKPTRLVGVLQDISRIREAEASSRENSEQLDYVARMLGLGMWQWNLAEDTIEYSRDYLEMMGYDPSMGKSSFSEWEGFGHPEDMARAGAALEDYLAGRTDHYVQEIRMRHKDGHYVWTLDTGRIVERDQEGRPVRLLGGHLNIDDMKRTEAELQQALATIGQQNRALLGDIDKARQDLEETRLTNEAMLDSSPYATILLDGELTPLNSNPAAMALFGFSDKPTFLREGMAKVLACIPERQPDGQPTIPLQARFEVVMRDGLCDFEVELEIDGRRSPLQVVMKRIPYGGGYGVAIYIIDLRSLKEAKNELMRQDRLLREINRVSSQLMAASIEDFDAAVWRALKALGGSVDADRMYIWQLFEEEGKPYCTQIYEWSEGAEPQAGKDFAIRSDLSRMPYWWATLSAGKSINTPLSRHPQGAEREGLAAQGIVSILVIPVFLSGRFWGFIGFDDCRSERVFSDIEEQILRSAAGIIVTAIQRNETMENLIDAREAALASARAKSEFLSRMSHEIRTPMNAIIGMTTIAKKSTDFDRVQYCLDRIGNASGQLLEIINDVLDMAKIDSGKLELNTNEFNFENMLQKLLAVVQVKADEKNQQFLCRMKRPFERNAVADELRLTQVLTNLLTNAVKFTPEGGSVTLDVDAEPTGEDTARLKVSVTDTGIGIPPEQLARLFLSFEQADGGTTRRYGGTGLGLAISQQLAALMGGEITVDSRPGEGSTFSFEANIAWGGPAGADAALKLTRSDIRILVVDDSEDVRIYFKSVLASFSLDCDLAAAGGEAVEMVRAAAERGAPYELVFLDWKMPGMDGAEAARQIKQIMNDHVVVIMISVADWSEIEQEVASYGVRHFLPKPILPSVLFNTIVHLTGYGLAARTAGEAGGPYHWQKKHLLLVEDVEINQEIIVSLLADTGVRIDCAVNGVEAVKMFSQNPQKYDMILMDVQMPELDGLGATRQIRASGLPRAGTVPIVAMTANAFRQDMENCLAAGMNGHVAKPIDVDVLMETLAGYLGE